METQEREVRERYKERKNNERNHGFPKTYCCWPFLKFRKKEEGMQGTSEEYCQ